MVFEDVFLTACYVYGREKGPDKTHQIPITRKPQREPGFSEPKTKIYETFICTFDALVIMIRTDAKIILFCLFGHWFHDFFINWANLSIKNQKTSIKEVFIPIKKGLVKAVFSSVIFF